MSTQLNPYISFKNNTRKAMEFYQTVFGGKLTTSIQNFIFYFCGNINSASLSLDTRDMDMFANKIRGLKLQKHALVGMQRFE